jgi:hypothetical protein
MRKYVQCSCAYFYIADLFWSNIIKSSNHLNNKFIWLQSGQLFRYIKLITKTDFDVQKTKHVS